MRRLVYSITVLTLLTANLATAETKYVIMDLGILPGAVNSTAIALNNKGQVVGKCEFARKVKGKDEPLIRSFLWENGRMTQVKSPVSADETQVTDINDAGQILTITKSGAYVLRNGVFKKIGGLPGYAAVSPSAINDQGDIAGWCINDKGYWKPSYRHNGTMKALPMPSHTAGIHMVALNDKGQAACTMKISGEKYYHAWWENGKMRPIKGMLDPSAVEDISDDGAVVGVHATAVGKRPFVLRSGKFTILDLPEGFRGGSADCINSKGVIAGQCVSDDNEIHPVVWDSNGVPTDLGTLGGRGSWANDINDAGVIVGAARDKDGNEHAVMWNPAK